MLFFASQYTHFFVTRVKSQIQKLYLFLNNKKGKPRINNKKKEVKYSFIQIASYEYKYVFIDKDKLKTYTFIIN